MKSIGIVISSYNKAKYLEQVMISLATQVTSFDQIVFVDDNSTDATEELFFALSHKYAIPVEYFFGNHVGTFENKKRGLQYLNTDYVIFLDADDRLASNAYDVIQKVIARSKNSDSFVTKLMTTTSTGELTIPPTNLGFTGFNFVDKNQLRIENLSSGPGSIFPTKILQNALSKQSLIDYLHDDWLMFAMLLSQGYKVIPSDESFYIYMPNENSVSRAEDFDAETNKTRFVIERLLEKNEFKFPMKNSFSFRIIRTISTSLFYRLLYYARTKKIFVMYHSIIKRLSLN